MFPIYQRSISISLLCLFLMANAPCEAVQHASETQRACKKMAKKVVPGIDVLLTEDLGLLQGKRVGLLTNPTGITQAGQSTIDALFQEKRIQLTALMAPEHGIRGDTPAGEAIKTYTDPITKLPVYSLYGDSKRPTDTMLSNIDVLIYDIQDIGSRSYTYINTMSYAMEEAFKRNITFMVLDRPVPYPATIVSGNILDPKWDTVVGRFPIPYMYGMTCGELARMIHDEGWLPKGIKGTLVVIPMKNYTRSMTFPETGLFWVPPSPHIPHWESSMYYSATGILGELSSVSIGVGYTIPFETVGHPKMDETVIAALLNAMNLPGVFFRPIVYPVFYGRFKGQECHGVQIYFTDLETVDYFAIQFYIYETLINFDPQFDLMKQSDNATQKMFDKVCGTDTIRKQMLDHRPVKLMVEDWKKDLDAFKIQRKKYLIYDES